MSPAELRACWRDTCREAAPDLPPDLLRRGIAYRLQERAHGRLPPATARRIERLRARIERSGEAGPVHAISLKPGTRLVRSWSGRTYHVLVLGSGFEFDGRRYGSLSHIAEEITGAHWSGPRFFGLRGRKPLTGRKAA